MRLFHLSSAVSLALLSTHTPVFAGNGPWAGSYSANGSCYCTGNLDPDLQERIVFTPTGERTVLQVCASIGAGPQLESTDGTYNYPVFRDPQCGHGPFPIGDEVADAACAGSLNPNGGDCQAVGPTWNFNAAAAPAVVAESQPEPATLVDETVELAEATSVDVVSEATDVSRPHHIKPPVSAAPSDKALVVKQPEIAVQIPENTTASSLNTGSDQNSTQVVAVSPAAPAKPLETLEERNARMEVMIERARQRLRAQAALEQPAVISTEQQPSEQTVAQNPVESTPEVMPEVAEPSTQVLENADQPSITVVDAPVPEAAEEEIAVVTEPTRPGVEDTTEVVTAEPSKQESVDESTAVLAESDDPANETSASVAFLNALRLPATVRQSGREFNYIAGSPIAYDFGGGGMQVEASASQLGRVRYLAQVSAAEEYSEVKLGAGIYHTPARADRMTLMLNAGVEYGNFALEDGDVSTSLSDTGLFLQAESRFVLNNRFELNAGVGYSSFFEGDPVFFGSGFYHINTKLDAMTRFEVGDNDSFGIGIRYFY